MDAIIVDNGPFARALCDNFKTPHLCEGVDKDPREIVAEVIELRKNIGFGSEQTPILINIEGPFNKSNKRQEQKGVDVLLWLRCKHKVANPVVLYSFQPNHALLKKKPEHFVIDSEGCYYLQLPNDFGLLSRTLLGVKSWDGLRKYLRPAFNIEQFRHREANWWGIVQLVDVHRSLYPEKIVFRDATGNPIQYPQKVQEALDTPQSVKGIFLYGHEGFDNVFEDIKCEALEAENRRILHRLREIEKKLEPTSRKNPKPEYPTDFIRDRLKLIEIHQNNKEWISNTKPIIDEQIKAAIRTRTDLERALEELRRSYADSMRSMENVRLFDAATFAAETTELRKACKELRVLYIDDQAKEGWDDVLQLILDSTGSGRFESIEISQPSRVMDDITVKVREILEVVEGKMFSLEPDLVLLDVRLVPEYDKKLTHDVQHLSGALLLREIRKEWPGIPVIITTASNKVWTYKELVRLGADGYWIKEGLDEWRSTEDSVRNYLSLLELISKFAAPEYGFLKSMAQQSKRLGGGSSWWQSRDWRRDKITIEGKEVTLKKATSANAEDVMGIYLDGLELFRGFLSQKILRERNRFREENDWFYYSSIVLHLGKIIELVHNLDTRDFKKYGSFSKVINHRDDKRGFALYQERNAAAHYGRSKEIDFKRFKDFVHHLDKYLGIDA